MLDRALLTLPLTGGRPIDSYDPRFAELADGVLRGRYIAAAEGASRLLAARHYDVRLVSYFLFGVVVEQGVDGLGWALGVVRALAASGWEGLGPAQSQQKHIKASIRWLFDTIARRLSQLDDDPQGHARFMEGWDDERRAALIKLGEELSAQLDRVGELGLAAGKVVSALRTLAVAPPPPLVEPTPPAPPPKAEDAAEDAADESSEDSYDEGSEDAYDEGSEDAYDEGSEDAYDEGSAAAPDDDDENEDDEDEDEEEARPGPAAPPRRAPLRLTAPPSKAAPAWDELLERLTLFEQLVADGATLQAAVVADDIEDRLNHFDPRRYFPALFVGYYAALADTLPEIEEAWEARDSARWRVLRQLYELDPERFRRAR